MNFKKIIFVIISFLQISVYAQTHGQAYYVKKSDYKLSSDPLYANIKSDIANFEYVLSFNDSLAVFKEVEKGLNVENNTSDIAKIFSGYDGPYYYDFNSKKILKKQGKYLINKDFSDYKWKLLKDKLVINNITCYKATTEIEIEGRRGRFMRPIVAWYSPEISIIAGPDGYTGLPGLIIQIEENRVVTTLTKITFSKDNVKIKLPKKGLAISEKDFAELIKQLVNGRSEN